MTTVEPNQSFLTLGWEVNATQEPKYWVNSTDPKPGSQKSGDLVRIPAEAVGSHTAIIAQSGSGKSFFLGRLVEEIALQTKARCVILDPNADFRRVKETEAAKLWDEAAYNPAEGKFKLPHEASEKDFLDQWENVSIRIRTGGILKREKEFEQFRFWWPSLSVEFLAEELEPMLRSDLYHCHAFVRAIANLVKLKFLITKSPTELIDTAEELFQKASASNEEFNFPLEEKFDIDDLLSKARKDKKLLSQDLYFFGVELPPDAPLEHRQTVLRSIIEHSYSSAIKAAKYASESVGRFYFGKAREYQDAGILQTLMEARQATQSTPHRIEVIDLPSLRDKSTRLLAINTILTEEWERARREWSVALEKSEAEDTRAPTFIVVDEAHNLIPNEPRTDAETALREQFRTIVAEGRKYGLFLILVSQRPDKLDSLIVSECENRAIMRLGSASVLKTTRQMLGLDDIPQQQLEKSLKLKKGRALLIGRWSPSVKTLYGAARRTVEGGRNLNEEYWAVKPQAPNPDNIVGQAKPSKSESK
jgi:hypothetical protein